MEIFKLLTIRSKKKKSVQLSDADAVSTANKLKSKRSSRRHSGPDKKYGETSPMDVPQGATGTSYYSKSHVFAKPFIRPTLSMVVDALEQSDIDFTRPFAICDYGCADGANSLPVIRHAIEWIHRNEGENQSVLLYYEDLPDNDFSSIHNLLQGDANLQSSNNVFMSFTTSSFYSKCFPDNFIDLAFSCTATHWLSRRPCTLRTALQHFDPTVSKQEALQFQTQGAKDWISFLLHRARELRIGGHLIIGCMAKDRKHEENDGRDLEMLNLWKEEWRKMVDRGMITQAEFEDTVFNCYFRSEEELIEPFLENDEIADSGLRLVSHHMQFFECPLTKMYQHQLASKDPNKDGKTIAREHAKRFTKALKVFGSKTFLQGLSQSRTASEKDHILEEFYIGIENEIVRTPTRFAIDITMGYLHVTKHAVNEE